MIHRRFASTILLTAFLLAVSTSVTAQNNPYQIADTCYVCMLKADALICREAMRSAEHRVQAGVNMLFLPGMLTFSVEDTGSGIPASEAERIFERFVKLDDFVQGTGLGLSICREITNKMGGKIFLDTAYSGGARFVFCVPLS